MNILLLVPRMNIGGAETHVAMLAPLLQKNGNNVIVVSGGGQLANDLARRGIKQIFLPLRLSTDLAAFLLRFIIKKYNIDLIHAHSAAAGITAVKCKIKYMPWLPVIYTAHGIFGNAKEKILLKCDKIITVSQFVYKKAIEVGSDPSKTKTIYNGIDTQKFSPKHNKSFLREKYGIPLDAFCLVIVSRIKNLHNKGHQHLINILTNYECAKNWHLIVIGTGKGKYSLYYQILKNNLFSRVHFLGHKTDIENYLDAADVIVLPSYFETFGLSIAEGMAMKKPAVAYDVGGTKEVIKDKQTGFLIPYADDDKLCLRLQQLSTDKDLRLRLGTAAEEDVKMRFSPTKMIKEIIDLYEDALSKRFG